MKAILSRIRDFIYPWHNKPENQSRTEARSHLCMTGVFFVLSFFMEKVRGVSLFTLPLFENDAYQGLLDIAIDTLLTTGLYLFMYYFVRFVYDRVYWIPKNKDKMLQGEWLHIHDKDSVRVGVVKIRQYYLDYEVSAENLHPGLAKVDDKPKTIWNYIGSALNPAGDTGIKFIGCYIAKRLGNQNSYKQGIHVFETVELDKDHYPKMLKGTQGDTIEPGKKAQVKITDKAGSIYFYRMTPTLKKAITKNGEYDDLAISNIADDPTVQNEDYVIQLKKILAKDALQKTRNELFTAFAKMDVEKGERAMFLLDAVLLYPFVGGSLNETDAQFVTGFDWKQKDMWTYYRGNNSFEYEDDLYQYLFELSDLFLSDIPLWKSIYTGLYKIWDFQAKAHSELTTYTEKATAILKTIHANRPHITDFLSSWNVFTSDYEKIAPKYADQAGQVPLDHYVKGLLIGTALHFIKLDHAIEEKEIVVLDRLFHYGLARSEILAFYNDSRAEIDKLLADPTPFVETIRSIHPDLVDDFKSLLHRCCLALAGSDAITPSPEERNLLASLEEKFRI